MWWISILCQGGFTARNCSFDKLDLQCCRAMRSRSNENFEDLCVFDNKDPRFLVACSCGSFCKCCTLSGVVERPAPIIEVRRLQLLLGFIPPPFPLFLQQYKNYVMGVPRALVAINNQINSTA